MLTIIGTLLYLTFMTPELDFLGLESRTGESMDLMNDAAFRALLAIGIHYSSFMPL